jgi:altronate hydrolase
VGNKILKVHPNDNVIVALKDLHKGEVVAFKGVNYMTSAPIKAKHKFTIEPLDRGDSIIMYGVLVGKAKLAIDKGACITTNNIEHSSSAYSVKGTYQQWTKPDISKFEGKTFNGYHRSDGSVGVMNYWIVVPLVFCENRNLQVIKDAMTEQLGYTTTKHFSVDTQQLISQYQAGASEADILQTDILQDQQAIESQRVFPNVDGIKFLAHEGGCGCTRQDSDSLCALIAGYINNPNVAGATILSLGCQNAQIDVLKKALVKIAPNANKQVYYLEQQESISEREFIADAVKQTFVGLVQANKIKRAPAPLSKLCLGLECGGSDGFSGITANPSLGYTSDLLVALGGKAILAEFPELNGVEQELINRCEEASTAKKFADLMARYSKRAEESESGFAFNPSPGNIKDGLITDAIKSAGAAKKGGTSPIVDVLDYTEQAVKSGLHLLCTPGGDVESTTGLAGSGANLIVFTTGLGTPTGNAIAPTIKCSTNSELMQRMSDIIDIDAGTIIDGKDSIESKGEELLELIIKVASGEYKPKAVQLGQDDFIPWKRGISL